MIDGITVLNQYLYTNIAAGLWVIAFAVLLLALFGLLCVTTYTLLYCSKLLHGVAVGGFAIAVLVCIVWSIIGSIKIFNTHTTRYEVTIEDSVSFNDVMENYEIIDQNGQIWTIEVKEKEE